MNGDENPADLMTNILRSGEITERLNNDPVGSSSMIDFY